MKPRKILEKLLAGSLNVSFSEFCKLIEAFGFQLSRVRGSHHIYVHAGVSELVNVQNVGGHAKPYQVRQFLKLVEEYNLSLEEEA
jgi:predicted RNA binding protein YcfA (HicA-like mRNA interferase family)